MAPENTKPNSGFVFSLIRVCAVGALVGLLGGLLGGAFSKTLAFVTHSRETHSWLLFLLPIGGIITLLAYRFCRVSTHTGTNDIIASLKGKRVNPLLVPLIFVSTAITHLFGGSAGREGAALQLGGAGAGFISRVFGLGGRSRTVIIMSGMSAVFAGVFGTPLTAAIFVLEFKSSFSTLAFAVLPCFIASFLGEWAAGLLGAEGESAIIGKLHFEFSMVPKLILLSVLLAILGYVLCTALFGARRLASSFIKNEFVRIVCGAAAIIMLTVLVGDMRYNGAGMDMALGATAGMADRFDFLLKLVFTAITFAVGFKGGTIVPTFCIGATFGCVVGGALGLPPAFAAALGLVGLFAAAAKSPFAAIFLGIELFSAAALPYFIPVCLIAFLLSQKASLFEGRHNSPLFK